MTGYGKRGGTSVNAGRKATTYVGTFPDGTAFKKRSFDVSSDEAHVGIYEIGGVWHAAGVARSAVAVDGVLRPVYHDGALPSAGQLAVVAKRA